MVAEIIKEFNGEVVDMGIVARIIRKMRKRNIGKSNISLFVSDGAKKFNIDIRTNKGGDIKISLPKDIEEAFFDIWGETLKNAAKDVYVDLDMVIKRTGLEKLLQIKYQHRLPMFGKIDVGEDYRFISKGVRNKIKVTKLLTKLLDGYFVNEIVESLEARAIENLHLEFGLPSLIYNAVNLKANSCMSNRGYDLTLLDDMGLEVAYVQNSHGFIVARTLVDRKNKLYTNVYATSHIWMDILIDKLCSAGYETFNSKSYKSNIVNIGNRFIPYMDEELYFIPVDDFDSDIGYITNEEPDKGEYVGLFINNYNNKGDNKVEFVFYDPAIHY